MTARAWLRSGLAVLALIQAAVGGWQYLAPRSFYDDVPTVPADPPFNEHLMTDVGGLGLAMALLLGASAVLAQRTLARVALAAYLVYTVSHLAFHVTHLTGLPATDAVVLTVGLAMEPAVAAVLLIVAGRVRPGPPAVRRTGLPGRDSRPADRSSRGQSW